MRTIGITASRTRIPQVLATDKSITAGPVSIWLKSSAA